MAKTKKGTSDENTVASHTFIVENSSKFEAHADTMKHRIEELAEENGELAERLEAEIKGRADDNRRSEARYKDDTTALKATVSSLEGKLRKVGQDIA